jgi:hypothetical protein
MAGSRFRMSVNCSRNAAPNRTVAYGQLRAQFLASGLFGECRVLAMDLPLKPPRGNGG